jgi:hypothetical protein
MNAQQLHAPSIAAPVVVGALVFIYGLVLLLAGPRAENGGRRQAAARFMAGALLVSVLALVILLIGMKAVGEPVTGWPVLGWLLSLFTAWIGLVAAGRGSRENLLRGAGGEAMVAVSLALLASRWAAGSAPVALALGALTGAAVLHGAAICARFFQGSEKQAWFPELSCCTLFALSTSALCIAARLGSQRDGGIAYLFLPASVGLLVGAIGLTLAGGRITRARFAVCSVAAVVVALPVDYLVKKTVFDYPNMFASIGAGMLCALIVLILAQQAAATPAGPSAEAVGIGGISLGLAIAVAFRLAQGYGVSLAGIGALAVLPFVGALACAGERGLQQRDEELQRTGASALLAARAAMAAAAAILLSALVRGYTAFHQVDVIDANRANTFASIVLGALMPFAIGALLLRGTALGPAREQPASGFAAGLVCGGQAFWVAVLSAAAPLATGFFFRAEAVGGYLVGLALASVVVVFLSLLAGAAPVPRAAGAGVIGCALFSGFVALVFSPAIVELQVELSRAQKARVLQVGVLAVFVWLLVEAVWRARRSRS